MKTRNQSKPAQDAPIASLRASISFPVELYQTLEAIARQKRVSVAWVVREATSQYVVNQWPLLGGRD